MRAVSEWLSPATGRGLPRSWKRVARRTRSGTPASAAAWTTAKLCSSTVMAWSFECESNPIAGPYSGSSATSTPVSRAIRSALRGSRRAGAWTALPCRRLQARRRCAHPRRGRLPRRSRASARALLRRARTRAARRTAGLARSEAGPRRSSAATPFGGHPPEIGTAAERVDELAVREPPRHRVDREVAAAQGHHRRSHRDRQRSRSRGAPARSTRSSRGGANSMPAGASSRIAGHGRTAACRRAVRRR